MAEGLWSGPKSASDRVAQMVEDAGFVSATADGKTRIVAVPAARIAGRVVTKLPGVSVTGLKAFFQDSHVPGHYSPGKNFDGRVVIDPDGHFTIDGLREGTVNVFVNGDGETGTGLTAPPKW